MHLLSFVSLFTMKKFWMQVVLRQLWRKSISAPSEHLNFSPERRADKYFILRMGNSYLDSITKDCDTTFTVSSSFKKIGSYKTQKIDHIAMHWTRKGPSWLMFSKRAPDEALKSKRIKLCVKAFFWRNLLLVYRAFFKQIKAPLSGKHCSGFFIGKIKFLEKNQLDILHWKTTSEM